MHMKLSAEATCFSGERYALSRRRATTATAGSGSTRNTEKIRPMRTPTTTPRKTLIAIGASFVVAATLAVPVAPAFAQEADTDTSEEAGTPSREERAAERTERRNARQAARDALRAWLDERRSLVNERAATVKAARTTLQTALADADSPEERRAAREAFKQEIAAAKTAFEAGIAALGPRPTLPGR
jgi:hypothetical protein